MNKEFRAKLRAAASKAFDAEFRDKLCNSVQKHILEGGKIGWEMGDCRCPQGCLPDFPPRPGAGFVDKYYRFGYEKHANFQRAFDVGFNIIFDAGFTLNPERALGLLYRERFYNGLPIQE